MRILARVALFFSISIASIFFNTTPVKAEGEFETDYDVNYIVNTEGKTTVTQEITLKNRTANFYADRFELKIGSTKVNDVTASDNTGSLETEVKFENNLTTIGVTFNQKVIGAGKSLSWTLIYSSDDLAIKNGQIWEVSIPRLARSTDIGNYEAQISIPKVFGPKAFAVPTPKEENTSTSTQTYIFDKDQLLASGISMSFGEKQVFAFALNYFIENNNVTSQVKEITLPPDSNYQKIVLEKLDPAPLDVVLDDDDNFIAQYKLPPRAKLDVTAEGFVEVFHKPFRNIHETLSTKEKDAYIQPKRYWETDNGFIKDKANELKTPEKIYEFVVNYLSYSQDRLTQPQILRKGAQAAAASPEESLCMEFTDLFIAIARAAGIPSREVIGFAYTQNERLRPLSFALNKGDILHAWPEYWSDDKGWIQIDPTWGSTSGGLDFFSKLDFNHITLTRRGLSSTEPLPPGAYKLSGQEGEKTVFAKFAQELPQSTINPELVLNTPAKVISGIPTKIEAIVKNDGNSTIYNQNLELQTEILKSTDSGIFELKILPPFATRIFDFQLTSTDLLNTTSDTLVVSYAEAEISKSLSIVPFYEFFLSKVFLASFSILLLIISSAFFIFKRFKKDKLLQIPFPKVS